MIKSDYAETAGVVAYALSLLQLITTITLAVMCICDTHILEAAIGFYIMIQFFLYPIAQILKVANGTKLVPKICIHACASYAVFAVSILFMLIKLLSDLRML